MGQLGGTASAAKGAADRAYADGYLQGQKEMGPTIATARERLDGISKELTKLAEAAARDLPPFPEHPTRSANTAPQEKDWVRQQVTSTIPPRRIPDSSIPQGVIVHNNTGSPAIGNSGKRRMLIALAQNPNGLTYRKLSILTGLSSTSGTWGTYLSDLRGKNFVTRGDPMMITSYGIAALGPYDPLPTGAELREYWQGRLGQSGKRKIFDAVIAAYPNSISAAEVSRKAGISNTSGTWGTYLAELRGLELISGRGELRASDDLF